MSLLSSNLGLRTRLAACIAAAAVASAAHARQDAGLCGGWQAFGDGLGLNSVGAKFVQDMLVLPRPGVDDALVVAGEFTVSPSPNQEPGEGVALWDGTGWNVLGAPTTADGYGWVKALVPDGNGGFFAGGYFDRVACPKGAVGCEGTVMANAIAHWDGTRWLPLGLGLRNLDLPTAGPGSIWGMARIGAEVWAWGDGHFTSSSGDLIGKMARWNGAEWSAIPGFPIDAGSVSDVAVVGAHIFVLTSEYSRGAVLSRLWRFDGSVWNEIFSPFPSSGWGFSPGRAQIASYDDGSGPKLYAQVAPLSREAPAGTNVVEPLPDGSVVTNQAYRDAILASGFAWKIRDRTSGMELLLVPPGTYQMGCGITTCNPNEVPQHQVTLTQPFYLGRYEVTQEEWTRVMGGNLSCFQGPEYPNAARHPVDSIAWNFTQTFMAMTGLRLPTEAEWEFACRAGVNAGYHAFPGYPNGTNLDVHAASLAWYEANNGPLGSPTYGTKPVGQKFANSLGFHDMLGNVREWVQDWYGSYSAAAQTDPTGPPSSPFLQKVARGGGFLSPILETRTFGRSALSMDSTECLNGFRAAKSAVPSGIAPYEGVLRLEGDPMLESSWRQLGGATAGWEWPGPRLQAIDSGPFRGLYLVGSTWSESEGSSPSVVRLTGSVELGYSWQSAIDADLFPKWSLSGDLTVSTIASWRDQMVLGGGWLGGVGKLPAPEFDSLVLWAEGENSWISLPATLSLQQTVFAITDGLPCEPGASCPSGWQPVNAESAVAGVIFPTGTQNGRYRALARVQGNWSEISSSSASSQDIGFNGPTYALAASAGGSLGNRIFAGGAFTNIDGNAAARVAGWNGSSWQALAGGFNDTVWSLATHESGGVNRLIAGGQFTQSGGTPLARIAQWNGSNWQPLGAGFDDGVVKVVRVLDDGSGPAIFAGGTFTRSGGLTRNGVAKWNGSSWQPLGSGITGSVSALEQVTFGGRRLIVAGGSFVQPGSPGLNRIAAWDALDGQWRPLGAGFNAPVSSLAACNTAEGTRLVAGGQFTTADGQPVQRFAVWDGVGWSAEGTSLSDTPWAMLLMDEGSSPKLALAGSFQAGPSGTNRYAEWSFCPGQCPSDIDGDAQINASDLSLLLVGWGGSGAGDIDGNGAVDAGDLGRLLADWGPCP